MDNVLSDLKHEKYRRVVIAKEDNKLTNNAHEKTLSTKGSATVTKSNRIAFKGVPL